MAVAAAASTVTEVREAEPSEAASTAAQPTSASERAPRRLDIQLPVSLLMVPIAVLGVYFIAAATAHSSHSADASVAASPEPQPSSVQKANAGAPPPSTDARQAVAPADARVRPRSDAAGSSPTTTAGNVGRPSAAASTGSDAARELAARQQAQARELAAAREDVQVNVYFAEWCPACRAVRQYLGQRGIRSVEYDVEKDHRAASRYRVLNPRKTIPTLDIEGQVLVGFDPQSIQSAIDRAARSRLARLDSGF